jgi:hypothetical protein
MNDWVKMNSNKQTRQEVEIANVERGTQLDRLEKREKIHHRALETERTQDERRDQNG